MCFPNEKSKTKTWIILIIKRLSTKKLSRRLTSFLKNKGINKESITLVANGDTLSNTQKISEILNTLFSEVVK